MTTLNDPISVEEKRARLAQLLREKASQRSYPLSFSQERLWFLEQLEPNSPLYNLFTVLRLRGALNVSVLTQAVNELVKRHESLRTVFVTEAEGRPAQRILPELPLTLPIVDIRELPEAEREAESRRLIQEEARAPFNLAEGPLLRARLVRVGEEEHLALLNMHHIITDGWSVNLFIGEMAALYHAFSQGQASPLRPVPMKYADFATWQRQHLQGEILDKQITYWKAQLAGAPPLLELPTDHPRPPVQRNHGANHHFTLPPSLVAELKQFSQQEGVTLFMTLLAAWKVLLYRYSGQSDVVVGSPIANRTRTEVEGLIGFFVNTLVFRTDVAGNPTFRELLQRVRQTALGAYNHQDLPFEQLVEAVKPPRTLSYSPLFQVMFVLQNTPKSTLKVAGLTVQQEEIESTIAKFDITLVLADSQQGMAGTLEYNRDLFDPATIGRLCDHFQVLVQGIVATPDQHIATLPLLTMGEKAQLLTQWNETGQAFPQERCWHEAFTAQAERIPNRVALVYGDHQLTYAELNDRANQLAHYLQALGVGPDKIVGLYLERSIDLVVGLLAILKAGGAYLPLDPTYPAERIQTMLADAKPPVLLTQQTLMGHLPEYAGYFVCLDRNADAIAQFSTATPPTGTTPDNLAYIIYTSGSTGKPKGVMVTHRSVMNLAYALDEVINPDEAHSGRGGSSSSNDSTYRKQTRPSLRVSVNGSVSFDTSVKQLVQVVHGHTLDITPQEIRFDGEALLEYLRSHQIDLFDCTPSQLRVVIESNQDNHTNLPAKTVLIGGEAIDQPLWDELAKAEQTTYYNVYGPTECTVDSTVSTITPETDPTIGRPIANTHLYVLDNYKHPVPIGVAGELYIGGSGVARGYFRHPATTAEKFIPDPFSNEPGARLYKTGDLVRYRANGTLEFIGRADDQVKIRGFRIELGEIETVLAQHPAVQAAAVLAHEGQSGSKQLVAYVQMGRRTQDTETTSSPPDTFPQSHVSSPVPLGRGTATPLQSDELRGFLQQRLPDYMVPSAFVLTDALPLTPNGKINRRALRALAVDPTEMRSRRYVAPRTPLEVQLAEIWESILGIPQVGVEDNFFEIGGHSLLATQLASRIRTSLQTEFPLRLLFETPTIAGMAQRLTTAEHHHPQPIPVRPASVEVPLSFAQERLWFLDQLEPDSPFYNIPAALRLKGTLKIEVLERAFNSVIARHETLRTYFPIGADGKPIQAIHPTLTIALEVEDIRDSAASERERIALEKSNALARLPFNLAEGPLLRVHLLQLADDEHLALLTLHHIITDGWSTNILISELATLYEAFAQGNTAPLSPLSLQYGDFALWQREWLQGDILEQQVGYWKKQLKGIPPLLEIPTDHPRPAIQTFQGAHVDIEIPAPLTNGLKKLSRQEGVTLFMTLLAAWNVLLYRYSGQTDVVVGSPIANRTRTELETIIGFFVNTLVLRSDLSGTPSFRALLQQVRETTLSAYSHQDLPFEQIVEAVQPERNLSHSPLFQVMFVLQNTPRTILKVGDLTVESTPIESGIAKFDLTLTLAERGQALVGSLEYNSDLFDRSTIERLRDHFHVLLQGIITTPAHSIATLPVLPPAEWQQVVHGWNENGISFDRTLCIHQWFEAQVMRTPTAIALVAGEQRLTYHELHERANQLAHHLQSLGVKPEQFVGVCMSRTAELLIALLGILKAGGAYAPLDPNYPADRLAYIVENARVQVILTEAVLVARLPATEATIVCVDQDQATIATSPTTTPHSPVIARNLAYVIYTSGSTGRPKGVAITHLNAGALFAWAATEFTPMELRGMLASTSINFDLSVYELFLPLSMGGSVILAENLLHLPTLPAANEVTLVNSVPSVLSEYLKIAELPPAVQTVNLAGEPLPLRLAKQVYQRLQVRKLYNLYGPSEDTTYSTWALIPREEQRAPSIGRAIANTQLYLLDRLMQPVPIGVAGELFLGGDGVAQGYLHRPALTAERFIPDPFSPVAGAKMYGTGDLARYRPDGSVEYLGRRDHQVKVRGFRIELGEIEAVLAKHPAVAEAVVIVREDVQGDKRLVGYVVGRRTQDAETSPPNPLSGYNVSARSEEREGTETHPLPPSLEGEHSNGTDTQLSIAELRQFLQTRLPSHMVPTAWVMLEALPQTPNGKVDRRALPAPDQSRSDTRTYEAPRTPTEEKVATVWAEILRIERVGRHDNFFALGGHSLLATQVVARLRFTFQIELPLRTLFEAPTVAELSHRVENAQQVQSGGVELVHSTEILRTAPLSFAQERLWFLDQLDAGGSAAYNVMAPLRVLGDLDEQVLIDALNEVIRRHEALRTIFIVDDRGRPAQQILTGVAITPTIADLSDLPADAQQAEIRQQIRLEAQQPFNLAQGPLVRLRLLRLSDTEHLILLTIHHIVTDGWSTNVLIGEIALIYPALLVGRPVPLPELTLQYADVAIWQRQRLQGALLEAEINYWKRQLADAPPLLELPTDHPRPAVQRYYGANHYFTLPATLTPALKRLSHQEGTTLFMTLLAAFKVLLYRHTGQSDVVVGSPIANRTRAELEGLIGFFVNTLALRTELADVPDFRTLLQRVREVTLDAYAHQELPFEQLVEVVQPPRSLAHSPIFQVLFVLQNSPRAAVNVAGLTVEPAATDGVVAKFDLTLTMEERQGGMIGVWEYNTDLFDRTTMERWSTHFQTLLESIVATPSHPISTLPLLVDAERHQLMAWAATPPASDSFVAQWLAAPSGRQPGLLSSARFTDIQNYILDETLHPVPIGVRGEWYMGGAALNDISLNNARLTAEQMIPDPFGTTNGARLYKTGELARYRPDGTLEGVGRIDQLARVRGVRIPLSEIEAIIAEHPDVADCLVMVRHDPPAPQRLVAYIVSAAEVAPTSEALRHFLHTRLPTHQIPTVWMTVTEIPLTADGTIDHTALPTPPTTPTGRGADAYVAPRTPLERQLAAMWAEILQVERVGIQDNFFALGGHSLLATQIVARVRNGLGVELPLRTLFEISTVGDLAQHIEAAHTHQNGDSSDKITAIGRTAPLSFAQERLWFLDQLEPNSALYNVPAPLRLRGQLHVEGLTAALNEVVRRHDVLRTRFGQLENGQPIQTILPALTITPTILDISDWSPEAREQAARERAKVQAQLPFNLAEAPLLRLELVRLAEDDHLALLTMHHIITDGWSLNVLISEIAMFYQAYTEGQSLVLPPLALQYADFARWQREWLQGEVIETQVRYWQQKLQGAPPLLELPTDRPRPAVQRFYGGSHTFALNADLTHALSQLSQREGATLFMTLLAAFKVLLSRYSGQSDVVVGSPIANRTRTELEGLIGFFVNTLVLRSDVKGNLPFVELLRQVRETTLEAYTHQELPFEQVVEAVEPQRSLAHSPLFQVMYVLQNTPRSDVKTGGLTVHAEEMESVIAKFDLTLSMVEQDGGITAILEYNRDLFDHATILRLSHHFQTLLAGIIANPHHCIATLPLLEEQERHHLLTAWNDTLYDYPRDLLVPQSVEAWAERTPTAVAVAWDGGQLTYADLNRRANQLAHYLQAHGVCVETPVAVCLPRSAELVIGVLAILKVGGSYLPLDPAYPSERLVWMVKDSRASLLLTQQGLIEPSALSSIRSVDITAIEPELTTYPTAAPGYHGTPGNLAYIIYTSGSTGTPKGTMLTHEGLLNLVFWHQRTFGVSSTDRATLLAGVGFDASVWELWPYLTAGARIHIPDEETRTDPVVLQTWLIEQQITVTFLPTPLAERMVPLVWHPDTMLRIMLTGGDRLTLFAPPDLPFTLVNNYGPTENTVVTTSMAVPPEIGNGTTPSIGYPIDNGYVYLLDEALAPVPLGVAGELYIGGVGVARGYLHRPALTAERFIPDPFNPISGARLYKTGDLARYRTDGSIEFLGRIDHQVKVRGFRIELGEIETLLAHHPAVQETAVGIHEARSGDPRIVAYIVPTEIERGTPDAETAIPSAIVDELRDYLAERLPDYMVPTAWVMLTELPLTPNGKVDRRALPAPDTSMQEATYVAPRTNTEARLATIWAEVLDIPQVSIHANFFALGGHSLIAVQLMARIEQHFGARVPLSMIFRNPTIAGFATVLDPDQRDIQPDALSSLVPLQEGEGGQTPLFLIHPVGGTVFPYLPLVAQLDKRQPVYGLQAQGIDGTATPLSSIEEMAAHYIALLRTVQPKGPYQVGGWSMGGVIAYEMARQLQAQGEVVAVLALLDSHVPRKDSTPADDISMLATFALDMGVPLSEQSTPAMPVTVDEGLASLLERAKQTNLLPPESTEAQIRTLFTVFKQNVTALSLYISHPYKGDVTLLRAETLLNGQGTSDDTLGWGALVTGNLTIHSIPGNHFTMVRPPYVVALAERMRQFIIE